MSEVLIATDSDIPRISTAKIWRKTNKLNWDCNRLKNNETKTN